VNIKDYISSGILEQYLLGELTAIEEKEVEKMMSQYPEIRQEYFMLADTFERMSIRAGVDPPAELKNQIMEAASGEKRTPQSESMSDKNSMNSNKWAAASVVAALIGLLIAAGIAYNCSLSKKQLNEQISALNSQVQDLDTQINQKDEQINQLQENLQILGSPDYDLINLIGLPIAPEAFAQVLWNANTTEVFLRADRLPQPETGKQYQLWAIVDNAPQSMGVFDLPPDSILLKMSSVSKPTAFAITLEPQGGVEVPTLEAMYVFGNVATG